MNHIMNLQDKYYNFIEKGTKRIELRLLDEKRKNINIGDYITFTKGDSKQENMKLKVSGLLIYENFEELAKDFPIEILADQEMTKKELLDELEIYYPKEVQKQVIGIRLKK